MSANEDYMRRKYLPRYGEIAEVLGGDPPPGEVEHAIPWPELTEKEREQVRALPMPSSVNEGRTLVTALRQATGPLRRFRLNKQHKELRQRMEKTNAFILVHDFGSYQADSLWKLVWLYLLTKIKKFKFRSPVEKLPPEVPNPFRTQSYRGRP